MTTIETETIYSSVNRKFVSSRYEKKVRGENSYTQSQIRVDESSRTGGKNPNWKAEVKAGRNATTSLSAFRYRNNRKPYNLHCNYTYTGPLYTWLPVERHSYGSYYSYGLAAQTVPSWMEPKANNQALTKYVSAANDARRILQSGEMIGEFAELVRQISSPGKSLRKGLGAYVETVKKRTQRKSVLRLPKNRRSAEQAKLVRDSWLEYQFGWRPLVSEIDSVIDYVNEEDPFSRYQARRIQGVGIVEESTGSSTKFEITGATPQIKARKRNYFRVIVRYRGQLRMRPSTSGYIAEKVGLHPADWIPTLWELVPYSFLIDYFTNIGDIISAFCLPSGTLGWTNKMVITESSAAFVDHEIDWLTPTASGGQESVLIADVGGANHSTRLVERSPYYGSFIPDWEFSIPGSGTKWLNMGALFLGSRKVEKLLQ